MGEERSREIVKLRHHALAKNSVRAYNQALAKIQTLPIKTPGEAMDALLDLKGLPHKHLTLTIAAVARWHKERHLPPPPFQHPYVTDLIKALRKTGDNRASRGAEFVHRDTLMQILSYWLRRSRGAEAFTNQRNAAFFVLQLWGMARFSEIANLKPEDLKFHRTHMAVTIRQSKTDQLGTGVELLIPNKSRDGIPLADIVLQAKSQTAKGNHIFPSIAPNKDIDRKCHITNAAWNFALRRAHNNIAPLTKRPLSSHSLRKSAARIPRQSPPVSYISFCTQHDAFFTQTRQRKD
eukprot:GHVQ01039253.1.p1 GENE.GHVQ01039253.1~~GHVQ01039253.1.p1  ORF type:complete len:293 (+),score=20.45 GHVQ01039253.1:2890-3768(+)